MLLLLLLLHVQLVFTTPVTTPPEATLEGIAKTQKQNHDILVSQQYHIKLITTILQQQGEALAQAGKALQGMGHMHIPKTTHGHQHGHGSSSGHHAWSYDGHYGPGPKNWVQLSDECGGHHESPINIDSKQAINASANLTGSQFIFSGYDVKPEKVEVKNNGHSIKMTIDMGGAAMPSISGGMLDGEYEFAQLHFHWGANLEMGSEHTWDNYRFPMEMHLVHFKKEHGSISESLKHKDGLAVLGVWFEVSVFRKPPKWLHSLAKAVKHIQEPGEYYDVPSHRIFPLRGLLPDDLNRYYRYTGSLTTPPCSQVVVWTIFREPLTIKTHELALFRAVKDIDGHLMVNNFRPLQPLHGRKIFKVGLE